MCADQAVKGCVQAAASPDHSVAQLHHLGAPHPLSPGGQVIAPDLYNNIVRNVDDQAIHKTDTRSMILCWVRPTQCAPPSTLRPDSFEL